MIKISSSLLFIIWITIALTACSTDKAAVSSIIPSISPSDRVNATSSPTEEEAEALFKQSCTSCHGVDLQGDFGPSLQKVGGKLTKAQIITQIAKK